MARFKNHLLVVVGFAIAGMIGAAFGTGTAQAVVSTLVTVVNPGTSPVHTSSVDDPGRIAYQSTVNNSQKCSAGACVFSFPSVPAGHRVVIQHVSGFVLFSPVPIDITVFLTTGAFLDFSNFSAPVKTNLDSSAFDQAVLFYVDASRSAQVEVVLAGNGAAFQVLPGNTEVVTLTGYELDCTVAACAPIATQ